MFCESPNGKFPCGKCRACKLRKVNEKMIISIFAAQEYKKKGQFLTLTFNDEHLPDGLDHSIIAAFMKRLRRLDGTPDVKAFIAGEYGEKSGREHWHILFYNHKYDLELVRKAWRHPRTKESFGFVYDGTLTPKSMKYVSGYISKKGYNPESGKKPPYGRMSCRLPDNLTPEEILSMCQTGKIQYNGRKFSVPTNWRRRYKSMWDRYSRYRSDIITEKRWDNYQKDPIGYFTKKDWTPAEVTAIMNERDMKIALKRRKHRI